MNPETDNCEACGDSHENRPGTILVTLRCGCRICKECEEATFSHQKFPHRVREKLYRKTDDGFDEVADILFSLGTPECMLCCKSLREDFRRWCDETDFYDYCELQC